MATKQASEDHILVAAIDFGMTFSGWAYQFKHDYDRDPAKSYAREWTDGSKFFSKTPTTVLINPDGESLDSFGFGAERKFAELSNEDEQGPWFYFSLFKMKLYQAEDIDSHLMLDAQDGKRLPAILVFSLVIEYMKKDLMNSVNKQVVNGIKNGDVFWVLTVPAIWNDRAKQFMRQAAMKAGIDGDNLMIALEPEAASLYCKQLSLDPYSGMKGTTVDTFSPGQKYLVIDAGGGTIDMNVHEVLPDNTLREVHKPTGSNWGGTTVGRKFEEFFCQLFGQCVINQFKEQNLDDHLYLLRQFEVSKREVSKTNETPVCFHLPISLIEICMDTGYDVKTLISQSSFAATVSLVRGGKLKIQSSLMRSFYSESINNIVSQVETVLKDPRVTGCNTILMVGGYSDANILSEEIKGKFPNIAVVTPSEASLAVLKGAVIYGRNPHVITSRVCKYTYGIAVAVLYNPSVHVKSKRYVDTDGYVRARNVFHKIVEVGQDVAPGHTYRGKYQGLSTKGNIQRHTLLYASTQIDPKFIDDEGCFVVGSIPVDVKDKHGNFSRIMPILQFGGTEIEVILLYETTGEEKKTTLRLPD